MIERLDTRVNHDPPVPMSAEIEQAMNNHFEELAMLLERMGHRPFDQLELRMPNLAHDCETIYRWDGRPWTRHKTYTG